MSHDYTTYYNSATSTVGYWDDSNFYTTSNEFKGTFENGEWYLYDYCGLMLRCGPASNLDEARQLLDEGLRDFEEFQDLEDEHTLSLHAPGLYLHVEKIGPDKYVPRSIEESTATEDFLVVCKGAVQATPDLSGDFAKRALAQALLGARKPWHEETKGLHVSSCHGYILCVEKIAKGRYLGQALKMSEDGEDLDIAFTKYYDSRIDAKCALSTLSFHDGKGVECTVSAG